jgi:predicted ferric reductase
MDRLMPAAAVAPTAPRRARREIALGIALLALGLGIGVAAGPASEALGRIAPEKAFWTASRLAAFLSYLAFAGSTAYGLGLSSGLIDALAGRPVSLALHRDLAWVGLALAAAHVFLLLGDSYIGFTLPTLLVPGESPYLPIPVAIGQIAVWAAVFSTLSYYARARMGVRIWRGLHSLSAVVVMLATVHGTLSGTDTKQDAVWWIYLGVGLVILFLMLYRLASLGSSPPSPRRTGL